VAINNFRDTIFKKLDKTVSGALRRFADELHCVSFLRSV